jgi:glutamate dehydrogenase/leucine dehydrogenase
MTNSTEDLIAASPADFAAFLREHGIRRFYLVNDSTRGVVRASHEVLAPLARFVGSDRRDFLDHEAAFFELEPGLGVLYGAFVHRTRRGQAAGGVRFWSYDTVEDYLRDGLRLAFGMTRKNALAGLWWGGGKGVMVAPPGLDVRDARLREKIYRGYGTFITSLRGCYVTAEDVGTHVSDMAHVFATTRHTTCIPPELGGSGNPSVPTARGVIAGIEAALASVGRGAIEGRTFAVQGCGNVGGPLIRMLLERGAAKVETADVDASTVDRLTAEVGDPRLSARVVERNDPSILAADCDVVAPCAVGGTLNPETIPTLRAHIVCGAANNQLLDSGRDDAALHARGILYVPDFLVNRMGIVTCADEAAGCIPGDPWIERHLGRDWEHSIPNALDRVLETSRATGRPPGAVATEEADRLSMQEHPVFGHRGRWIIDRLVEANWQA